MECRKGRLIGHIHRWVAGVKASGAMHKAIVAGGKDNAKSGVCDDHPGCGGGYVLDPEGNNTKAVCSAPAYYGRARRNAGLISFAFARAGGNST